MLDEHYLRIPLLDRKGAVVATTVVDQDFARLAEYRWHRGSHGYARRNVDGVPILMHRVVLGLEAGDSRWADHINRDRLDNRRANLRVVTRAENMQNVPARRSSTSRFRAVYWERSHRKWRARARVNGRSVHIGFYASEIDAGLAAEAWRSVHMPFAEPDPALSDVELRLF